MAVLAVPLGMIVSGDEDFVLAGSLYGLPVLLACIGYLLIGWEGIPVGIAAGILAFLLAFSILS